MRPMQKSPGGLSLSARAFLHKADVLCEVLNQRSANWQNMQKLPLVVKKDSPTTYPCPCGCCELFLIE